MVKTVAFNGPADQAGVTFRDVVTGIDVERTGLPSKQLVYPFALVLLGLVVYSQVVRSRRQRRGAGTESTAA